MVNLLHPSCTCLAFSRTHFPCRHIFHLVIGGVFKWADLPDEYVNIPFFVKQGVQDNVPTWPKLAQPEYEDGDNNADEVEEQLVELIGDELSEPDQQPGISPDLTPGSTEPTPSSSTARPVDRLADIFAERNAVNALLLDSVMQKMSDDELVEIQEAYTQIKDKILKKLQ